MRAYNSLSLSALCERLCVKQNTLIIFHAHPDGDAMGSAFALCGLLNEIGSRAFCVCADEPHRRYRFAVEGLQESVLPENLPVGFKPERIITVDTASRTQMGRLADIYGESIDLMIDHHGMGEQYADSYVDPQASATAEIIFDASRELLSRGDIKKLPERFNLLCYLGIATDTGGLKYSNTTPDTHRRVAELMDGSFDYADVNFRLFDAKTPEELKITRAALESIQYFCDGEIAVTALSLEQKAALGVPDEYLDVLINVARSIEGVKIAASVKQADADGTYKISLRSACDADVSEICAKFGGGGHRRASGCAVKAQSVGEAVDLIVREAVAALKKAE